MKTGLLIMTLMVGLVFSEPRCAKLIIQTCSWGLGRFPIARTFIQEDIPIYGVITVDYKAGGNPRFSCRNEAEEVIEVVDFSAWSRTQMREKLKEWGFETMDELSLISEEL